MSKKKKVIFSTITFFILLLVIASSTFLIITRNNAPEDSSAATTVALNCKDSERRKFYFDFEKKAQLDQFNTSGPGSIARIDNRSDGNFDLRMRAPAGENYVWSVFNTPLKKDFRILQNIENINVNNQFSGHGGLEISYPGPEFGGVRYYLSRDSNGVKLNVQIYDKRGKVVQSKTSHVLSQNQNIVIGIDRQGGQFKYYYRFFSSPNASSRFINNTLNNTSTKMLSELGMTLFYTTLAKTVDISAGPIYKNSTPNFPDSNMVIDDVAFIDCANKAPPCTNDTMCASGEMCTISTGTCVPDPIPSNPIRIMTINYNPQDTNFVTVADRYYPTIYNSQNAIEYATNYFNELKTTLSTSTDNTKQFEIIHNLTINEFQQQGDFTFTTDTYARCADSIILPENEQFCLEVRNKFNYVDWANTNNICALIEQYDIDMVWMFSLSYVLQHESFILGPDTGDFNDAYIVSGCNRHVAFINGTYDSPQKFMHSFAHHVEESVGQFGNEMSTSDKTKYIDNFLRIDETYGTQPPTLPAFCGNAHFPFNTPTGSGYIYDSLTPAVHNCQSWSNFPNVEPNILSSSLTCTSWDCDTTNSTFNDQRWQHYWLSYMPSNTGSTTLTSNQGFEYSIYNNWWEYVFDIDNLERLRRDASQ